MMSIATTTIIQLQDLLGVGAEGRMNKPGEPDGNWLWRFKAAQLTETVRARFLEMTKVYDRA